MIWEYKESEIYKEAKKEYTDRIKDILFEMFSNFEDNPNNEFNYDSDKSEHLAEKHLVRFESLITDIAYMKEKEEDMRQSIMDYCE